MPSLRRRAVTLSRPAPGGLPASWRAWWSHPASALMESGRTGRWTILVPELPEVWFCRENVAERRVYPAAGDASVETVPGAPDVILEKLLALHGVDRRDDAPDFQGGVIALLSYDLARRFEKIPEVAEDDLGAPLAVFAPGAGRAGPRQCDRNGARRRARASQRSIRRQRKKLPGALLDRVGRYRRRAASGGPRYHTRRVRRPRRRRLLTNPDFATR